jgi:hypothetical protein
VREDDNEEDRTDSSRWVGSGLREKRKRWARRGERYVGHRERSKARERGSPGRGFDFFETFIFSLILKTTLVLKTKPNKAKPF